MRHMSDLCSIVVKVIKQWIICNVKGVDSTDKIVPTLVSSG